MISVAPSGLSPFKQTLSGPSRARLRSDGPSGLQQPIRRGKDLFETVELKVNHRQSEGEWLNILTDLRRGVVGDVRALEARVGATFDGDVKPVRLFPLRADVAEENQAALAALPGEPVAAEADYTGAPGWQDALRKDLPADDPLILKPGAQVKTASWSTNPAPSAGSGL